MKLMTAAQSSHLDELIGARVWRRIRGTALLPKELCATHNVDVSCSLVGPALAAGVVSEEQAEAAIPMWPEMLERSATLIERVAVGLRRPALLMPLGEVLRPSEIDLPQHMRVKNVLGTSYLISDTPNPHTLCVIIRYNTVHSNPMVVVADMETGRAAGVAVLAFDGDAFIWQRRLQGHSELLREIIAA